MIVKTFPVGPLACNCSILADENTGDALIIDPGDENEKIASLIREQGYRVRHLLHTHAHFDHIGATCALKESTKGTIALHKDDLFLYENFDKQIAAFGLSGNAEMKPIDHFVTDGCIIEWGKSGRIEVVHTPGHTPGSLTFLINDLHGKPCVFTGDTLFMGSIGRTDLWGGDTDQILDSIKSKLIPLSDETRVIPGHGPNTTIAQERKTNPFLVGL